jgi:putative endonuclease
MYTVYVLYSEKYNKHYTGYTNNLMNRLKAHNELGIKGFTVKYRPWRLIYQKEFELKTEAMTHEKWLKSGVGRDCIKLLEH